MSKFLRFTNVDGWLAHNEPTAIPVAGIKDIRTIDGTILPIPGDRRREAKVQIVTGKGENQTFYYALEPLEELLAQIEK